MEPLPQAPQTNPYDFINNPAKPPKQPLFGGMKQRVIAIVGILIILAIVGGVVSTILGNRAKGPQQNLKDVVAMQQEIIRVADMSEDEIISTDIRGYVSTVKLTLMTDQAAMNSRISAIGIKMTSLEKGSKKNTKVDEALETSKAANRYDETVKQYLEAYLEDYLALIKTAYDNFDGVNTREDLQSCYNHAVTLLGLDVDTEDEQTEEAPAE